jgi:hypothetical protein
MAALAINPPDQYANVTDAAPIATTTTAPKPGLYAFIHLLVSSAVKLANALPKLGARLGDDGMIEVWWRKKTSRLLRDVSEDGVRTVALPMGLIDVKVCGLDADWSGLRLMHRKAH